MPGTDAHNREVIAAFRAGRGDVGDAFGGMPMLLLHHTGARTGAQRVTPLVYWAASKTSVAVLASNFGAPSHPAWYHNLIAHPNTTIELGPSTLPVKARVARPTERATLLAEMVRTNPGVSQAVNRTRRDIPVVILDLADPIDQKGPAK